ncbi:hypothetical protein AMS68_002740 [Peltaster fructicola]|uniref:MIND kinetochore complex component Nnf1 n=1 Tax=Peltaster fructicola TaxID=286661 RepID=A0A6H0XR95_9PEZI|nr:hypothetical protein AMS68_002740 [Peltaster fructicola]
MSDDGISTAMEGVQTTATTEVAPQVTATPGPRAAALQRLYSDATTHVLKTCSYKSFASCFPSPAHARPDILKDLHKQFTTDLGRQMRLNFDVILQDSDVVQRLNELDYLIDDAKRKRAKAIEEAHGEVLQHPIASHTLPARELYLAHLAPSLSQMSQALSEQQDGLANENVQLLQAVMQQRRQIKELMEGLETTVAHLEQAATMLSTEDVDKLRDEVRNADEEMRATT